MAFKSLVMVTNSHIKSVAGSFYASYLPMVLNSCSNTTSINLGKTLINIKCSLLVRIFTITKRTFEFKRHCEARREFIF